MRRAAPRRRFFGLDLAWAPRNASGLAVLDERGRTLDLRAERLDDAAIVAWIRGHLAAVPALATVAIAIDMPTIVRNPDGARPCETELRAVFGRHHAGPHPANLRRFPDGGRARAIVDALAADGIAERIDLAAGDERRFAIEVFPHPAHVRLFSLDRIFAYKKKSRPWPLVLSEWRRYRAALATLRHADPPLVLPRGLPVAVAARGYKHWDDCLDALTCAYVAAFVWRWGTRAPHVRVFGDLASGYIVVPDRPAAATARNL